MVNQLIKRHFVNDNKNYQNQNQIQIDVQSSKRKPTKIHNFPFLLLIYTRKFNRIANLPKCVHK